MATLLDELADYVELLAHSADATTHADDRNVYVQHLAAAAKIFAALHAAQIGRAKELVRSERHGFGWGFLSGDAGSVAESAFHRFASIIEAQP